MGLREVVVLSELIGHPREPDWYRAYIDAKRWIEEARGIEVVDVAELAPSQVGMLKYHLAVLFHIIRASDVEIPATQERLKQSGARQGADEQLALGIIAVGDSSGLVAERIYILLGQAPGPLPRWIEGVAGLEELRQQIAKRFLLLLDLRRIGEASPTDSEVVLAEELPITEEGAAKKPRLFRSMP